MILKERKIYAVLTGDLVKSSLLSTSESAAAMEHLRQVTSEYANDHPNIVVGEIDTFRHDSWQLLLENHMIAFRVALYIRASLKMLSDAKTKYDTRISIGLGSVESVSKQRISDSRGGAFTCSGKGLDRMTGQFLALSTEYDDHSFWGALKRGVTPLLDCVASDWTPTESRAIHGALKGWTQEETARNWPKSSANEKSLTRQAVSDSLIRAHWSIIEDVLKWIEKSSSK